MNKNIKVCNLVIAVVIVAVIVGIGLCVFLITHLPKDKDFQSQANTTFQDASESTSATNHIHNYIAEIIPATCEKPGYTLHSCACGEAYQADDVSANSHAYGEWEVVLEATTEAEGEREKTCVVCGNKITEPIPKLEPPPHIHNYSATVIQPTCQSQGYTRYTCACGHAYNGEFLPAQSHLYGDWTTITPATTSSTGSRSCSCIHCGQTLTEAIPQLSIEDAELYEKYVDTGILIERLPDGAIDYSYGTVSVTDTRSWGEPPSVRILNMTGLRITYQKQDGSPVEVMLEPIEGYARWMVIQKDGSYTLSLFGDFND